MTSRSDLFFGSKSEPPLPLPRGSVLKQFLKVCSLIQIRVVEKDNCTDDMNSTNQKGAVVVVVGVPNTFTTNITMMYK